MTNLAPQHENLLIQYLQISSELETCLIGIRARGTTNDILRITLELLALELDKSKEYAEELLLSTALSTQQ